MDRMTESEVARWLAGQIRVALTIRTAAASIHAPERLREAIASMCEEAGNPDRPPRP